MRTIKNIAAIAIAIVVTLVITTTSVNAQIQYTSKAKMPELNHTTHGGCFYYKNGEQVNCKGWLIKAGGLYEVSEGSFGGIVEIGYRFPKFIGSLHTRVGFYGGFKAAEMDGMKFDQVLTGGKFYLDLTPHSPIANFYIAAGFQYNSLKIKDNVPVSWLDKNSKSDDTVAIYSGDNKHNFAPTATVGVNKQLSKHIHASAEFTYVPVKISTPMGSRTYNQQNVGVSLQYHF